MKKKNLYWKITEKIGYRESMLQLGFSEAHINSILHRIEKTSSDDYIATGIREKGYFYVSIEYGFYTGGLNKYEWNDFDCYGPTGYNYKYMGELFLRKQKLEKLKDISNGKI
jgi:hypothetical protein